jgi:hypothetical protein
VAQHRRRERAPDDNPPGDPAPRPLDPGAYIGHEPELAAETIPGGVQDDDERVAAHSTQGTGSGRPEERGQPAGPPAGHRQGDRLTDDDIREAGQNR